MIQGCRNKITFMFVFLVSVSLGSTSMDDTLMDNSCVTDFVSGHGRTIIMHVCLLCPEMCSVWFHFPIIVNSS